MSKDKKKGVDGIKGTRGSKSIERTKAVADVKGVKKVKKVSKVAAASGITKAQAASAITKANLGKIYSMIEEEASKLFSDATPESEKRLIVEEAVKMAIQAAALEEEE